MALVQKDTRWIRIWTFCRLGNAVVALGSPARFQYFGAVPTFKPRPRVLFVQVLFQGLVLRVARFAVPAIVLGLGVVQRYVPVPIRFRNKFVAVRAQGPAVVLLVVDYS